MKINYLDLFSGIGGFAEGLVQAGFEFNYHAFSEVDKNAIKVYEHHFPNSINLGDIKNVFQESLREKINLITFGFPCQDMSIVGKGRGFEGNRSSLFFEAMRIIEFTRPNYIIFENVKGLLTNNRGREWLSCLRELANIGYDGQWQLCNTGWILPQDRYRVYFVGYPRGTSRPRIFPIEGTERDNFKEKEMGGLHTPPICTQKVFIPIIATSSSVDLEGKLESYARMHKQEKDLKFLNENLDNIELRRLTHVECERLQGFKDGWTSMISPSERYKCIGNAVSVPIVELITKKLLLEWK